MAKIYVNGKPVIHASLSNPSPVYVIRKSNFIGRRNANTDAYAG